MSRVASPTRLLLALLATVFACAPGAREVPTACDGTPIDRFKELEIVDDSVVDDARARNASAGPWSFRHAAEQMAPSTQDGGAFVHAWLDTWAAADPARGSALQAQIVCPWLRATSANACDATCSHCAAETLDLGKAPFRLVAISNRLDLGDNRDALSPAGEGRLVFAMTDGPADSPASLPVGVSVIFEYALRGGAPSSWARSWHALSGFAGFDDDYKHALEAVTGRFVDRDADGGSALSQARTNDGTFGPGRVFREFALNAATGALTPRGLRNTPRPELNGSATLRAFVADHAEDVRANLQVLPPDLRADAIDTDLLWVVDGVDEPTRKAFADGTCNGCHASEVPNLGGFHVSPFLRGTAKLSTFIHDPNDPSSDDLARREGVERARLCAE